MSDDRDVEAPARRLGWPTVLVTAAIVVLVFVVVTQAAGKIALIYAELGIRLPSLTQVFMRPTQHGLGAALLFIAALGLRRWPRLEYVVGFGIVVYFVLAMIAFFLPLLGLGGPLHPELMVIPALTVASHP